MLTPFLRSDARGTDELEVALAEAEGRERLAGRRVA